MAQEKIHVRQEKYSSASALIADNIPFQGAELGYMTRFYFDPSILERIVKDIPRYNMLAMLGEKPSGLEQLGMEVFLNLFHANTGIWLHQPETYKHLIE